MRNHLNLNLSGVSFIISVLANLTTLSVLIMMNELLEKYRSLLRDNGNSLKLKQFQISTLLKGISVMILRNLRQQRLSFATRPLFYGECSHGKY